MEFQDYYKALGVEAEAETADITKAYRRLARKYHPDVSDQEDAEARFKEIAEAYAVLKDKDKRAEYDELRKYGHTGSEYQPPPGWQHSSGGGPGDFHTGDEGFSDFFDTIFGAASRQHGASDGRGGFNLKGQDVEVDMPIFLEETIADNTRPISFSMPSYSADGRVYQVDKKLNVRIPHGVVDGERVRLKGQGAPGVGDGPPGDLYLHIRFAPHPVFDVDGHDLLVTVPLAPWEAALGKKISVPTLEGDIKLAIPTDSQSGQRLRARGKGLPTRKGSGDLYAVLNVVMPAKSDVEMQQHWRELEKTSGFNARKDWRKK